MKRIWLVCGALAIFMAPAAWALTKNAECVLDAKAQKQLCVSTCQENFRFAKDLCWNVDHDCADACRAGRDVCVAPIYAALQNCLDPCSTTLEAAKTVCRNLWAEGTPERDTCIDDAQGVAFGCRDTCREQLDREGLIACRAQFRACITACPAAN